MRTALTLCCFIRRASFSIASREITRPCTVVVLVAVDAADQHGLAVHEQAPVADLDGAEADAAGDALVSVADDERVERGLLGRPQSRRADTRLERVAEALRQDGPAARIEEGRLEPALGVDGQPPVGAGRDEDVRDRVVGAERNLSRDARVPPLILVLDEARVGPAHHDSDELVRPAAADEVGDVELGRGTRVLRDAHGAAVEEHVQHTLDTAEMQAHAAAAPVAGKREGAAVDPGRVLVGHGAAAGLENGITTFVYLGMS